MPKAARYLYVGISRPQWHKQLVVEHYQRGLSCDQIARLTGVPGSTVRNWCKQEGLLRTRRVSCVVRRYSPSTDAGRARLQLIRTIVSRRSQGETWPQISSAVGCTATCAQRLVRTPYARALKVFVYGNADGESPHPYALDMHFEMGLPSEFIARTLGRSVREIDRWIRSEARRGRTYCSSTHGPQGRRRHHAR